VDGGAGRDTARVSGAAADFTLTATADGTQTLVDGNAGDGDHGTVRLAGIERIQFDDAVVTIASAAPGGGLLTGTAGSDVLYGGAANDRLVGLAGDDQLFGGAGDDTLDGRAGNDRMEGGAGNDSYLVDAAGDVVVEASGEGIDTVRTTLTSYTLGANVEALQFQTAVASTGFGNALGNNLFGGTASDALSGLAGDDRLVGGAGDDVLTGGVGKDVLEGGTGADRFVFATGDFATLTNRDVITDFGVNSGDVIDLRSAEVSSFIGSGAFTGIVGEVRAEVRGAYTYVQGDVNGDGAADFAIQLAGALALSGDDLLLA
jgi:Ca2+-binding RTX toxin-like protein